MPHHSAHAGLSDVGTEDLILGRHHDGAAEGHCRQRHHLHQGQDGQVRPCTDRGEKCEVVYGDPLAPHDDDTLKDFHRVELENITLLGAPVLPGSAIDKAIKQKREKMEKAI